MAVIEELVIAVAFIAAGFALVLMIVITGIHQEERRGSLGREDPPTALARLGRRMLGGHFSLAAREDWAGAGAGNAWSARRSGLAGAKATGLPPAAAEIADQTGEAMVSAGYR